MNAQSKKRILIIEDNMAFLKSFYEMLVDEGYYVAMTGSSDSAKDWATNKDVKFDMIISDHHMPGESGASFLTFLSELEKVDSQNITKDFMLTQKLRDRFGDMNDVEFVQLLNQIKVTPHIRVILSGYAADASIEEALKKGVIHKFISKKTPMNEILQILRDLFAQQRN